MCKEISNAQCESLIEKRTTRIRGWSSRNLTYTARVQLVSSVLLSLHVYWAQVFTLPKKVLVEINKIVGRLFGVDNIFVTIVDLCHGFKCALLSQ